MDARSSSTAGSCPVAGAGRGERRKNPTDNAARTAKPRNVATMGQRRLVWLGLCDLGRQRPRRL